MASVNVFVETPEPIIPPKTVKISLELSEAEAAELMYVVGFRVTASPETPLGAVVHSLYSALHDANVQYTRPSTDSKFTGNILRNR